MNSCVYVLNCDFCAIEKELRDKVSKLEQELKVMLMTNYTIYLFVLST